MNTAIFSAEIKRLKNRFGSAHFDEEYQKLLWVEVRDLPDQSFQKIVNHCIGEFKPEWPPKISDFRSFANEQRSELNRQANNAAVKKWNEELSGRERSNEGLGKLLKELGAKSLLDAIRKRNPNEPELKNMTPEKLRALTKRGSDV